MTNHFKIFGLILLFFLASCAATPLSKNLTTRSDNPLKIGILGFKVTAPIKRIASIEENPLKNLTPEDEEFLVSEALYNIEEIASNELVKELEEQKKVKPVLIPISTLGIKKGEKPTAEQLILIKKKFGVDAVFYGEIPWYGTTNPLYPSMAMTADISAESILIYAVTTNIPLVAANVVFELVTGIPLWFGGSYVFGHAFRPVTIEGKVISLNNEKEIWDESFDQITSSKILKTYPKDEQEKKEIQLKVSLQEAVTSLAKAMSK